MRHLVDIAEYLMRHKSRSKVLPCWTDKDIENLVIDAHTVDGIACYLKDGKVQGVTIFFPNYVDKVLWVTALICETNAAFKFMVTEFEHRYKGFEIAARRKKKIKFYKTKRLCHLISI